MKLFSHKNNNDRRTSRKIRFVHEKRFLYFRQKIFLYNTHCYYSPRNGVKRNVVWNETSDYDWVYPYVLGDSVGGDLRCEEYYFAGGYAREYGRVTWGGTLDYRAAVEFRNIDPRPKNVVGELNASLGISLRTKTHYGIGMSAFATKYKQSNEIKFYSELGQSKVYHFTGMGMDYARFSGNNNSAYYKGKSFGGNIGIHIKRSADQTVSFLQKYRLIFLRIFHDCIYLGKS